MYSSFTMCTCTKVKLYCILQFFSYLSIKRLYSMDQRKFSIVYSVSDRFVERMAKYFRFQKRGIILSENKVDLFRYFLNKSVDHKINKVEIFSRLISV